MEFIDQLGRKISLDSVPERIISLVPSQTELLYDLGLRNEVAGITKFCIHPDEWFRTKTRIGGTKKLDLEKIKSLNPDLVIGNREENDQFQVEELMKQFPVWMSDIKNLDGALLMMDQVGSLVGKQKEAGMLINRVEQNFKALEEGHSLRDKPLKAVYLIWNEPMMSIGSDTFIHDMMEKCGLHNAFGDRKRYPEITLSELAELHADLVLLSSEPFPFSQKHLLKFSEVCPGPQFILVDGEYFSWYGSRLLNAPNYFRSLVKQIKSGN